MLAADFYITEFMASNDVTILDEDGDSSDWIEVTNAGDMPGTLDGWHLTDNASNLNKWQLPDVTVQPGEFLLVWASNKDRTNPGSPLHTDFKLGAAGEYLALVEPDGATVKSEFAPSFPQQFTDISYGLAGDPTTGQPRYFLQPSPGASNAQSSLDTTPFVTEVMHAPAVPLSSEDITVTATVVEQGAPLSSVTLTYRVMYGAEFSVTMFDDGAHADGAAGDGVYGGVIPSSSISPGEMVRWYVTAENTSSESGRFPLFASSPDAPAYDGTIIQDFTDPELVYTGSQLPVYHWFVQDPAWFNNGDGTLNKNETSASIFYDGVFYDNVHVRARGEPVADQDPPKLKFRFNDGYEFRFSPEYETVKSFNLESTYIDHSYVRQEIGWEVFREAGAYAPLAFPVHTRQNGDFDRLSIFVERINKPFLRRNGLGDDGAVYKSRGVWIGGSLQPDANLGVCNSDGMGGCEGYGKTNREEIDASVTDLQSLINGIRAGSSIRDNYLFDNINIPEVINVLSAYAITKHFDRNSHNFYIYRDSDGNGEWSLLPTDIDTIFDTLVEPIFGVFFDGHPGSGASDFPSWTVNHWNHLTDAVVDNLTTREMYARRLRTLMDQILQPPGTPINQRYLENRVDEMGARLAPEAIADYNIWGLRNSTSWQDPGPYPAGLSLIKQSFADRRSYLYTDPSLAGLIPSAQVGNPQIDFGVVEFNPTSGNQDQEYIELVNNNSFAVDISGWQLTGGVSHTFAPGTVITAGGSMYVSPDVVAFRARTMGPSGGQQLFVQGDYSGHLSNFGETLNLLAADAALVDTVTYAGNPSLPQQYLRISEINYNPYDAMTTFGEANVTSGEFEFIELVNTSGSQTLDLNGVQFIAGVTFDFTGSAVTSLAPGERTVVVKNQTAFESRYGTGLSIAGTFASGGLANGGEAIKLDDATGSTIQQFSYNDSGKWPGRADGKGGTLEVIDTAGDYDSPENWRSSNEFHGTPGAAGSGAVFDVIVNEVLSHSDGPALDKVELYNTTGSTIDLEGWHLTDTHTNFLLHTFGAGVSIAAGAYRVLDENQLGFALDGQLGDDIWLVQGDPAAGGRPLRFADHHDLDATETNVSLGRVPNGDPTAQGAALFPVVGQSFGTANSSYAVGAVVISEVFYHTAPLVPPNLDIDDDELDFVELYNRNASTVDVSDWRLRQNDGSDLTLPAGTTIATGDVIVLVRFDPLVDVTRSDAFRTEHGIGPSVTLVGLGAPNELDGLNNSGEEVELLRPEDPGNPLTGYLLVDRASYDDAAPWPTGADGVGDSLTRTAATNYGNYAASWVGAAPSPGSTSFAPLPAGDMTGDGLVNLADVGLLLMALVSPSDYAAAYPHLDADGQGDVDDSGTFDLGDISAFTALFGPASASAGASANASPEMSSLVHANDSLPWSPPEQASRDLLLTVRAIDIVRDDWSEIALSKDEVAEPNSDDSAADVWDLALLDLIS